MSTESIFSKSSLLNLKIYLYNFVDVYMYAKKKIARLFNQPLSRTHQNAALKNRKLKDATYSQGWAEILKNVFGNTNTGIH